MGSAGHAALRDLVRDHRRPLVLAVAVSALAALPALFVPLVVGQAVDALRAENHGELHRWALVLAGLAALTAGFWALRMVAVARIAFGVEADMRQGYFDHLIALDLEDLERDDPGQLVARGTADLRAVRSFLSTGLPSVAQLVTGLLFVVIATAAHHPYLGLVAVVPAVGILLASWLRVRGGRTALQESRERLGDATRELDETLMGMVLVRAAGRREARLAVVRDAVQAASRAMTDVLRRNARFEAIVSTLPLAGVVVVLYLGAHLAIERDELSDGGFVSVYLLLLALAGPTSALAGVMMLGQAAAAAAARVVEVLARPAGTPRVARAAPAVTGTVDAAGIRAGYGDGEDVLTAVDLVVVPGARLAIAGQTGSGKSLLLRVLAGVTHPRAGRADLGGRVALSSDDDALFSGTVRDAIAYGRRDASDEDVRRAAKLAGADEFVDALPRGYDSTLGGRTTSTTLSGGQRQRLMLARAVLVEPEVLLLDGATASLDAITERAVMAAVADGRTVLASSERASMQAAADEVIVLAGGRVADRRAGSGAPSAAMSPAVAAPTPTLVLAREDSLSAAGAADAPTAAADAPAAAHAAAAAADAAAARDRARAKAKRRVRALRAILGEDRRLLLVTAAIVAVATAAALAPAYIASRVIDDVLGRQSLDELDVLGIALGAAVVVYGIATWASGFLVPWLGQRALVRMRLAAFERLLAVPMSYFDRQNPGQIISKLTNNIEILAGLAQNALSTIISASVLLLGTGIAFLVIDPELALIAYATIPFLVGLSLALGRGRRWANERIVAGIGDLTVFLRETVRGARTMRAYGQEEWHRQRFAELNRLEREALRRAAYVFGAFSIGTELVVGLDVALLILVGGNQALAGAVSVGTMVAFATYLRNGVTPISTLATMHAAYGQSTTGLDAIVSLMELPGDPDGDAPAPTRSTGAADLRFEHVWFAYDRRGWVLRDVTLSVPAGQHVLVVGSTGAGKSTLLRLALRFYRPIKGTVALDGVDLATLPDAWLRRQIAIVPQEPFLFTGTVAENIAFARPEASRAEVERAVADLGATAALAMLPGGLDARVGAGGVPISSGQRQLVALARALLADPRLLLLDEATSVLDPETEAAVEQALGRVREQRTTLVVAHRLTSAPLADKIVVMRNGQLVEHGTHDELLARGRRYAALWQAANG